MERLVAHTVDMSGEQENQRERTSGYIVVCVANHLNVIQNDRQAKNQGRIG